MSAVLRTWIEIRPKGSVVKIELERAMSAPDLARKCVVALVGEPVLFVAVGADYLPRRSSHLRSLRIGIEARNLRWLQRKDLSKNTAAT